MSLFDPRNISRVKGKCEGCGKIRALSPIDSGQLICDACLREIKPPRPKHLTSWMKIDYLRRNGFNVSDDLLREDGDRLCRLIDEKRWWPAVPADTPMELLDHLMGARYEELESGESGPVTKARTAILNHAMKSGANPDIANAPRVRYFFTKIVGVTHRNNDGSDRQAIIAGCSPFESLQAEHEDNPHDPNAIRVSRLSGEQIGYLSREVAAELWWKMQHGFNFAVIAGQITGGAPHQKSLGMNVVVVVAKPEISPDEIQAYVDSKAAEIINRCRGSSATGDEDLMD
jgi:hypothetical protein